MLLFIRVQKTLSLDRKNSSTSRASLPEYFAKSKNLKINIQRSESVKNEETM